MASIRRLLIATALSGSLHACGGGEVTVNTDALPPERDAAVEAAPPGDGPPPTDAFVFQPGTDAGGPEVPASECMVVEQMHELLRGDHVASTAGRVYNSNPPSSGPHCGSTVAWGAYPMLDRCYWLHNLEHAGAAVLYNCPQGCPEITAEFNRISAGVSDPDCPNNKRILFAPYPELDTKVAASVWGFTWKANCLDAGARASLIKFINDHIGTRGIAPEKDLKICN